MFRSRNGFGLDSVIILISTIAIIVIMIGVGKAFMTTLENSYVSLTTSMPKFDATGNYDLIQDKTNSLLSIYNMLRSGIIWAIAAVLMISGILFMLEQIQVVPASTAFGIISKGTLYFIILFGFPPIWDLYASTIEVGSKAIMDPGNTGKIPQSVTKVFDTINGMGISQGKTPQVNNSALDGLIQLFNGSDILSTFSDQGKAVILGAIGSLLSLMLSFMTYMFAAIRQVLTAVLVAGLPVILILSLVPWFQGITKRLYDTLFGLSLVPIFSALVMVTGAAYLNSITTHPVEEQWFASVAVLTLSTFIPTILVPLLGSLFSSITSMTTTATGFGGVMGMMALKGGKGIASGAYGAAVSAQNTAAELGQPISGIGMAKAAMGGGIVGGFGGLVQGLSHLGSHTLKHLGAKEIANEIHTGGTAVATRLFDMADNHGKNIGLDIGGKVFADNSENIIHNFVLQKIPLSEYKQYFSRVPNLLQTIDGFTDAGDYHLIAEKFGYDGPNASKVGKSIQNAVASYVKNEEQMAKISYLIENGKFTTGNLQHYEIKELVTQDSGHETG